MNASFGDICLINFDPSIGKEYKKVRPALVLQSATVTKNSPYITVMPISSKIEKASDDDVFLSKDKENKLFANSIIKVQQISSFDKRRMIKIIGKINGPARRRVRGYIRRHFNL